jgi:hypothetical protein
LLLVICIAGSLYFTAEFAYWLKKKKEIYADQLKAEESRKYFEKFVKKWNGGELSEKYYEVSAAFLPPFSGAFSPALQSVPGPYITAPTTPCDS